MTKSNKQKRLEILAKVANKEISIEEADHQLFVLSGILRSKEQLGIVKHINGTLRTVIKTNKEDPELNAEWNIMCLKHCINQIKRHILRIK